MKNKGFVLMETIVVIVVVSVALLSLFSSYNKILSKIKSENRYDNPEHVYMTYYIKEKLPESLEVYNFNSTSGAPNDYSTNTYLSSNDKSIFKVKKIHIVTGIGTPNMVNNLNHFDAYMIDYLRKLDVTKDDKLIIVEFSKEDKDENYANKFMYKDGNVTESLTKTYIASLKW